MKIWSFNKKSNLLKEELKSDIKSLKTQLDEQDLKDELYLMKDYTSGGSKALPYVGGFGVVGEDIDKFTLQKLFCTEPWLYTAVSAIAKSIASAPTKMEKKKLSKTEILDPAGNVEEVWRETFIDASAEPEHQLLRFPNDINTSMEFWMLIIIDLLATGEAFIYQYEEEEEIEQNQSLDRLRQAINNVRKTGVKGLYRISSPLVRPEFDDEFMDVKSYLVDSEAGTFEFDKEDIIHIRMPNPCNQYQGLAPAVAVIKNLLLDRYTAEHMIRFYKQGARLGGVIKTTKKLNKDQLVRLERTFDANFTGKKNHHKTLILPEGMDYQTIEQNPGETSLIEFFRANKEPILSAYGTPPIKVGLLDGATFSNALIQDKSYYTDTVIPISTLISQSINKSPKLIKNTRNLKFSFDFSEIESLQDYAAKATNSTGMINGGLSINEVRQMVWKKGPIEGGEIVPAIQSNQTPEPAASPFFLNAPEGDVKEDVANIQNDTETNNDIVPTETSFEQRVADLTSMAVSQGIDINIATMRAIQQALMEGFVPTELTQTEDEEKKTEFDKEYLVNHWKVMSTEGVAEMLEARQKEVEKFFKRLENKIVSLILKSKNYNYKVKVNPKDVVPSTRDLKEFIFSEIERLAEADMKAMQHGYKNSVTSRSLTFPNKRALGILKKIGGKHITSITNTTRKKINNIITSSFTDQVSVNEIAARIRDVFPEMTRSRSTTIARTETLTAVSLGQELKRNEFKRQFPTEAAEMKKVWITAKDERVRDTHEDLEGKIVGIDEEFKSGLRFPRDPNGKASEVINCRCTMIEFFPEDQAEIVPASNLGNEIDQAE